MRNIVNIPKAKIKVMTTRQLNCTYGGVLNKIPKGWRLPTISDVQAMEKYATKELDLYNIQKDFPIEQPFEINKKAGSGAYLNAFSDKLGIILCFIPNGWWEHRSYWVGRFVKNLKVIKNVKK